MHSNLRFNISSGLCFNLYNLHESFNSHLGVLIMVYRLQAISLATEPSHRFINTIWPTMFASWHTEKLFLDFPVVYVYVVPKLSNKTI